VLTDDKERRNTELLLTEEDERYDDYPGRTIEYTAVVSSYTESTMVKLTGN
jgi:hypothetical protein